MGRAIFWILVAYVAYTQYLIHGYDNMNTRLLNANTMLLRACSMSTVQKAEESRYK